MNLSNNEIKSKLAQQFDVEIADYPVLSKLNGASGIDYLVLDEDQVLGSALEAIVKRIAKDSVSPYVLGMNGSICWISINEFKWEFCFDYLFDDSFQWLIIHNACDDTVLFLGADLVDVVKSVLGSDIESIEPFIRRDFWYGVVKTHTSNLGLEYKHDTRRYFLSKTKIRVLARIVRKCNTRKSAPVLRITSHNSEICMQQYALPNYIFEQDRLACAHKHLNTKRYSHRLDQLSLSLHQDNKNCCVSHRR